jgi:PAS domain S-box-containing protein
MAQTDSFGSDRDFRLIIDSIPGLVSIMSAAGELEFVNRQLLQYFDRSLEELKGWATTDAVHPDDLARTISGWRRAVESGRPVDLEHRLRRGDGVYNWFHFCATPLRDATGRVSRWYALLTNTEDLKRAQESLRTIQERLSRATHLATLSELSAGIAHEINQPLAAVVANGHACYRWLSAHPPNIERALLTSEKIIRDGNLAAEIIRRVQALFSRSPPVKQLLSVNGVIEEVCGLISADLRTHGVVLETDLRIDLPLVAADRIQLQQVVINLARNGAEAMDSTSGRPKLLLMSSQLDHDMIVVRVTDHGVGFSDAEKMFESFYSTKPNGMGMGLAICRSIAEAHGGRLWAEQNASCGATFSLALPRASADYEAVS